MHSVPLNALVSTAPVKGNVPRIIHVPRRFIAEEWGGTETVILEISRYQQKHGLAPEIVTSLALAGKRRTETIGGIPVRRFPYFYPFIGASAQDKAAWDKKGGNLVSVSLFNALYRTPDVRLFHSHAINRLGAHVRTVARLRHKPYVLTLHGGVLDVPVEEAQVVSGRQKRHLEWGNVFGALLGARRVIKDADLVICVGYTEAEKLSGMWRDDRVVYLPNGVGTAKFSVGDGAAFRHKHNIPQDAFLVANISRIDAQKNQLDLVRAFARLRLDHPNSHLVLIGPETQADYAAKIRAFIKEEGLEAEVTMLPGLANDDPDLVNAYHACDVFALNSRHEPFGIVVLEAWSCGKAVVASHIGGLMHLVEHERTGLFCYEQREGETQELAAALLRLARDPGLRRQLGENGKAEALEKYDWSIIAERLEDFYQQAEEHAAKKWG
jgi:glycosyltransferase involved in cell wall biosynthesis